MNLEFLTQLVILITALVGLYKAATYSTKSTYSAERGAAHRSAPRAIFEAVLSFAGIMLFVLVVPAFIWALSKIASSTGFRSSGEAEATSKLEYQISSTPSAAELALAAALEVPSAHSKSEALKFVVSFALDQCEGVVAIAAARQIPSSSRAKEGLQKIIDRVSSDSYKKVCLIDVDPVARMDNHPSSEPDS